MTDGRKSVRDLGKGRQVKKKKVSDGEKSDTWTEREKSGKGRRNKETNGDGGIRRQVDEKGER